MSEVVTKNDLAKVLSQLPFLKLPLTNLVDGSEIGSIRGISTAAEDSQYKIGDSAFAEGYDTKASGVCSHAEGSTTVASGHESHAEGILTKASGQASHAEGMGTIARGNMSHAQNYYTIAAKDDQTVIGKFNLEDVETDTTKQKAFIIGNGTNNNRSNAFTVDWSGEAEMALDTSATSGTDKEIYDALVALGWASDVIG